MGKRCNYVLLNTLPRLDFRCCLVRKYGHGAGVAIFVIKMHLDHEKIGLYALPAIRHVYTVTLPLGTPHLLFLAPREVVHRTVVLVHETSFLLEWERLKE